MVWRGNAQGDVGYSSICSAECLLSSGWPSRSCGVEVPSPLWQLCSVTHPPSHFLLSSRRDREVSHMGAALTRCPHPHKGIPRRLSSLQLVQKGKREAESGQPGALCSAHPKTYGRGTGRTRPWPFLSNYLTLPLPKKKTRHRQPSRAWAVGPS